LNSIPGIEALRKMKALRHSSEFFFIMHHITWNEKKQQSNGIKVVRKCRIRAALPEDKMFPDPDLFLPYIDLDAAKINQNRMCRKRLIRFVAFPPEYEMKRVDWLSPLKKNKLQTLIDE